MSEQRLEGYSVALGVPVTCPRHATFHRISLRGHMESKLLDPFLELHGQSPFCTFSIACSPNRCCSSMDWVLNHLRTVSASDPVMSFRI